MVKEERLVYEESGKFLRITIALFTFITLLASPIGVSAEESGEGGNVITETLAEGNKKNSVIDEALEEGNEIKTTRQEVRERLEELSSSEVRTVQERLRVKKGGLFRSNLTEEERLVYEESRKLSASRATSKLGVFLLAFSLTVMISLKVKKIKLDEMWFVLLSFAFFLGVGMCGVSMFI